MKAIRAKLKDADVLDEFDHVLGSRSVDTYSDEVDETQANQMIEAAIDKYY